MPGRDKGMNKGIQTIMRMNIYLGVNRGLGLTKDSEIKE